MGYGCGWLMGDAMAAPLLVWRGAHPHLPGPPADVAPLPPLPLSCAPAALQTVSRPPCSCSSSSSSLSLPLTQRSSARAQLTTALPTPAAAICPRLSSPSPAARQRVSERGSLAGWPQAPSWLRGHARLRQAGGSDYTGEANSHRCCLAAACCPRPPSPTCRGLAQLLPAAGAHAHAHHSAERRHAYLHWLRPRHPLPPPR